MPAPILEIKIYRSEDGDVSALCPSGKVQYFCVLGRPQPQERPRMGFSKDKDGNIKRWAYTPKNSEKWQHEVLAQVLNHKPKPVSGPFTMVFGFYCPRLKDTELLEVMPTSESHGDIDNLQKAVQDAICGTWTKINGVRVKKPFPSDANVVNSFAFKRFHADGDTPHVKIWVVEHD
jgi:Holliday junction resolvase RusA-like endonuclease